MSARTNTSTGTSTGVYPSMSTSTMAPLRKLLQVTLLCALASGCTGVSVERDTPTSGTYTSTAWAFTILSRELPRPALMIARSNAADIQRPDMRIESEWVFPDLRWFDWLLDIVGIRYARVSGTWGYPEGSLPLATDVQAKK